MKLFMVAFLSLTGLSSSNGQHNKTKRWLQKEVNEIHYPSAYQQVSLDDSTKSIGASRHSAISYRTPRPLILFTPAAVLEQQEARVRHIYLKPTPSSPPPPRTVSPRAKSQRLEAQPQFHSYSTFILPPQLQSAVVPTTYPIRHQPTAYYGYATVPPVTVAPVQQQQQQPFVKHVYLDQKHPVLHYHYQTYPNAKPLVIHNSIPQSAPKAQLNLDVKAVTEPQEDINEEVRNRQGDEEEEEEEEGEEEEVEGAPERENVRENDEEDSEEKEPVKQEESYEEEEDEGEDEKENLEEENEDVEKENIEDEEDNRRNYGPQVFYRNNEEDEDEPEQKKRYRDEESEDEEEEENQRHDVKVKPSFGFDYQRFAEEYKSIQYPKSDGPIRIPIKTNVPKAQPKKILVSTLNAKPYSNSPKVPKRIQKPNSKAAGANINVQFPYPNAPRVAKISNTGPQKPVETTKQQQTVPVLYQRLRNYFTPTPIVNAQ